MGRRSSKVVNVSLRNHSGGRYLQLYYRLPGQPRQFENLKEVPAEYADRLTDADRMALTRDGWRFKLSGNKNKTKSDRVVWALAEMVRADREAELRRLTQKEIDAAYGPDLKSRVPLVEWIEARIRSAESPLDKRGTQRNYIAMLRHLRCFDRGKKTLARDVDRVYLKKFKEYLENRARSFDPNCTGVGRPLARRSVNQYSDTLRAAFGLAMEEGIIKYQPRGKRLVATKKEKGNAERIKFLDDDQLAAMMAVEPINPAGSSYDRFISRDAFFFACHTGLRQSDLRALTWGEVRKDRLVIVQEKTGDVVEPLLSDDAIVILDRRKKPGVSSSERVFDGLAPYQTYLKHIKDWGIAAGVGPVTTHMARHTCGARMAAAGIQAIDIQKQLGHKTLQQTLEYVELIAEYRKREFEKVKTLPPIK